MKHLFRFLNIELISFLKKEEKKKFSFLILLMSIFALVEAFTYSIIIPYLNVVIDPQRIFSITQLKPIFEFLSLEQPITIVLIISGIFISLFTIKTLLHFSVTYYGAKVPNNIAKHYTDKLYRSILLMPYQTYMKKNTKSLLKLLTHNNQILSTILNSYLLYISQLITCLFLTGLLLIKNTSFSIILLLYFVIIGSIIHRTIKYRQKKAGKMYETYNETFYKQCSESLNLYKDISLYNKTAYYENKNNNLTTVIFGTRKVQSFLTTFPGISLEYIVIISLVCFIYFLTKQVGNITDFATIFIFYAVVGRRLMSCMGQIISQKNTLNYYSPTVLSFINEFNELVNTKSITHKEKTTNFSSLSLKNISFSYKKNSKTLSNISIEIKKNEHIAFVGPSGGGKSTLIDIMSSFLEPDSGELQINNKVVKNLYSLKPLIGYVPQMMTILDTTITHNITLTNEYIDKKRFQDVIKIAHLDDMINTLDHGLETILGDKGIKLSGGQRQRIAIARALYQKPEILIFDEATASLDAESEKKITESIKSLKGKMTVISIAHRLSTIKNFDKIYVIDNGTIISSGKHNDLINSCNLYERLVKMGEL